MTRILIALSFVCLLGLGSSFMTPSNLRHAAKHQRQPRPAQNPEMFEESNAKAVYNVGWYPNQTLDHFNYNDGVNSQKWSQRYLFNSANWGGNNSNSPIFFYTGNEGDITAFWNASGYVTDILPVAFKAYVLFVEHRYFGESLPFGQNSYINNNQLFLTTEQALADYVQFISWFKNDVLFCPDCPVIAFGGSYGGMLSGWMRMKFPNIVDGAIAASAPLLLFDYNVPPEWAYQYITYDFGNSSQVPQCAELIKQGFNILDSYINDTNGNQYEALNQQFDLCTEMSTNSEISDLEDWLIDAYFTMAQGNYPYPCNFLGNMPAYPVNYSCQAFTGLSNSSSDESILQAMLNAALIFYNFENVTQCNEIFSDGTDTDISDNGWDVLTCNEMVLIMTSGYDDMFPVRGFNYTQYTQACQEQWNTTARYDWALDFYGGWDPEEDFQYYSNIFFSNGLFDPWRAGGVQENISSTIPAYIMPSAHHLDLRLPNVADPLFVQYVRGLEATSIRGWIQEKWDRVEKRNQRLNVQAEDL